MGLSPAVPAVALGAALLVAVPRIAAADDFEVLHEFQCDTGCEPFDPPVIGPGGHLFGLTYEGGAKGNGVLYEYDGQTYTVLLDFADHASDLQNVGGVLYGTSSDANLVVTLWSWDPARGYRTVYTLPPQRGISSAIVTSDETMYTVGSWGSPQVPFTLYRYDPPNGAETLLHTFPTGDPVQTDMLAQGHQLFGTTAHGPWVYDTARAASAATPPPRTRATSGTAWAWTKERCSARTASEVSVAASIASTPSTATSPSTARSPRPTTPAST
jgi:uncharacterized repeat protein (TIGR03803 family)